MNRFQLKAVIFATFLLVLTGCAKDFEVIKIRVVDESARARTTNLDRLFSERVLIEPSGTDKNLAAGYDCFRQKLWGSSQALIENHLIEKPSDWRGHYLMALLAINDEDHEKVERCLHAALRFSPSDTRQKAIIYLALGATLESQGKPGLSQRQYLAALDLDSSLSEAQDGINRLTPLMSAEPR